jgi:hypothetical protein
MVSRLEATAREQGLDTELLYLLSTSHTYVGGLKVHAIPMHCRSLYAGAESKTPASQRLCLKHNEENHHDNIDVSFYSKLVVMPIVMVTCQPPKLVACQ